MPQITIFFCKVTYKPQLTMYQILDEYNKNLRESINPDLTTTRYGKIWRFSQPKLFNSKFFVGKLGYTSAGIEKKTYYDEKAKDFIEKSVDSKLVSYSRWAIDLSRHLIAFEVKPPDIRYTAFVNAFKSILDQSPSIGMTIEHMVQSSEFYEWVERVDKVTKFTANLRAPNPDYQSRTNIIKELLELPKGDSAKVEIRISEEAKESLDTSTTISDLVQYGEEGYSTVKAQGLKNGHITQFDSRHKTPSDSVDIPPTTLPDKIWDYIIDKLKDFKREKD